MRGEKKNMLAGQNWKIKLQNGYKYTGTTGQDNSQLSKDFKATVSWCSQFINKKEYSNKLHRKYQKILTIKLLVFINLPFVRHRKINIHYETSEMWTKCL